MRLKSKIVAAVTGLVFIVSSFLSWLYLSALLQQHIEQSYSATDVIAHQVLFEMREAFDNGLRGRKVDVNDPAAFHAAVVEALRGDKGLNALMNSIISYSPTVFDVSIADHSGRAILSTDPSQQDQLLPRRPAYGTLLNGSPVAILETLLGPPRVYDLSLGLERYHQPFLVAHIGIRTTLLRNAFEPWLVEAMWVTSLVILSSLAVSAFLANLALKPLEQISRRLDLLQAEVQVQNEEAESTTSSDTVVQVSDKIERIGKRMRNVEEVFSALKENLDQILSNLQDGMMLFTRDARAVLISSSVERFIGVSRDHMFGATIHEIFNRGTILGRTIRQAFDAGISLVQEEVITETGRRVEVSLDFIHDEESTGGLGALVTLHDLESLREIENELELSRRMASIGRLTSGVGHEVKNPINAIVLHLELLRNKLNAEDSASLRHLDIIRSEIQRLDRVVQTLVDFSRPVELRLHDQDLRTLVASVLSLASAELETHGVTVVSSLPQKPITAKVDADLFKQALLNIVLNGAQSMQNGGRLEVRLAEDARWAVLSIGDQGSGIPSDVLPKIFDLYFTTKRDGSGIGLAMTYRIVQLHNGRIDVESHVGRGTTFTLRVPATTDTRQRVPLETAGALLEEQQG